MKISKRSLVSSIALALTISVTAFGTVAYMTDSDTVTNKFTVGNINITVDETDTDGSQTGIVTPGTDTTPARDQQNSYELIPGLEQVKDPTVTIAANSESCYVRMRVEMKGYKALKGINPTLSDLELLTQFVTINTDWTLKTSKVDDANDVISYEFRYKEAVAASTEAKVLTPLFNTFTVPITYTGSDLAAMVDAGFQLDVHGDAVQTEAFDGSADAAWAAYDYQVLGVESAQPEGQQGTTGDVTGTDGNNAGNNTNTTGDDENQNNENPDPVTE